MPIDDIETRRRVNRRRLPVGGYVALVAAYLVVVQLAPALTRPDGAEYGEFRTVEDLLRSLLPAVLVGSVVAVGAVAVLRWWRPVLVDDIRTPRWTWVFPVVMLLATAAGAAWGEVLDRGAAFTVIFLGCALLIGVSEETMFRGLGVVTFRQAGFSEGLVALWTCVLFGLAHATNLFTEGIGALPQVVATALAGYFLYLARRASGLLLVAVVVHALWDLGLFSNAIADDTSLRSGLFIGADVVLGLVALLTFRKVFPRDAVHAAPEATQ